MSKPSTPGPLAVIAELTHRCPLHCVYCSNPLEMAQRQQELATETWQSVFTQAAQRGVLQLYLTGGEPLARPDLEQLVIAARASKLYVNLITSGIGLNATRLEKLVAAGLDHIQLSIQDSEAEGADKIAGTRAHEHKLTLAKEIRKFRIGFTLNAVVHRHNLARLPEIIALAETLGVGKLEIANVQYYGWAYRNRENLLPTREQLTESLAVIKAAQERLLNRLRIEFVVPDYYGKYPKACMGGWGRKMLLIDPTGKAMPCHAAGVIPDAVFPNVAEHSLKWIWHESEIFRRFRGEDWMQEPCRGCERRTADFGGCRCQAMMIANDPAATDPACSLSPQHHLITSLTEKTQPDITHPSPDWVYRENPR